MRDGKARYETISGRPLGGFVTPSGTVQLYESGGKRTLGGQSDDGKVTFNASLVQ